MNKVDLIKIAKALKNKIKRKPVHYVSYCRRIERVKTDKRICAMTFDDGPTYDAEITKTLVETLNEFNAVGTFDVIGTTEGNYPDVEGKVGTPTWSGTKYDHYPRFNADKTAGAVNCPDLIDMIISSGHEITNHTYSHILFGKKNVIYSKRNTLSSFDKVYDDVKKLHEHLKNNHGYEMSFSRPPHYVDKIKGGFTSYDAYAKMGYQYLAASFDGAGWLPCESEEKEIEAMVEPLERALRENPDALCGQIIFQKDGYNMGLRAPVKEGLRRQLEVLGKYGYEVVGVSKLLEESPFADIGRDDEDFEVFARLVKACAIAFNDNTLRPDKEMTKGELAMLIAPREIAVDKRIDNIKASARLPYGIKATHPYSSALVWAINEGYFENTNATLSLDDVARCRDFFEVDKIKNLTRREIYKNLRQIF